MATARDYYEILGVSKSSTEAEIKAAYRKLALQYHPDRNKEAGATDKFKEINQAYEVLGNADKRKQYDQFGHAAFDQSSPFRGGANPFGGAGGPFNYTYSGGNVNLEDLFGGFSDPFDIFESFFGGGRPFRQAKPRTQYEIKISFMDAVSGIEKKLVHQGKSYSIKVPAGCDDGTRIRFNEFDLVVRVSPHPKFTREGLDVITEHEISFPLAALGGDTVVETLEGDLRLKIKAGTQSGNLVRLTGKGMKSIQGNRRGDFYVRFTIKVPTKLSRQQKQLLEQLSKL